MRLIRLLAASVGPLVTWAWCQATIWSRHRRRVRPKERTSGGQESSPRSWPSRVTNSSAKSEFGVVVDAPDDFFGMPGHLHLTVGVTSSEQPEEAGAAGHGEPFVCSGEQPPGP